MSDTTSASDLIRAIGSLWPLVATVCLTIVALVYREQIRGAIRNVKKWRFKGPKMELSVEHAVLAESAQERSETVASEARQEPERVAAAETQIPPEPVGFFFEMYNAFERKEFEEADAAYKKMQAAELTAVQRSKNEALYCWLMYSSGRDTKAIEKLEKLATNEDVRETALFWMANCYEFSGNYPKAIDTYSLALEEDLEDDDRARHTTKKAKCLIKLGEHGQALEVMALALEQVQAPEAKADLYHSIADLEETIGNTVLRAIAFAKVLEYKPEDKDVLFRAAYAQSDAKLSPLCVTNYLALLRFAPDHATALNNLGVECDGLDLPMRAVSYYRKAAAEQKYTLAMANLANKYVSGGFRKEAKELLEQARSQKDPHRNVGEAMARLADSKEEEEKAWKSILEVGIKQQLFLWRYAEACFPHSDCKPLFAGEWVSPSENVFVVTQEGARVLGAWENDKMGEKFEGTVHNRSMVVEFRRKEPLWGSAVGSYWPTAGVPGFAYLTDDGSRMSIHLNRKDNQEFFDLTRSGSQK